MRPKFRGKFRPFFYHISLNLQVPSSGRSPVRQGDRWGADVDWVLAGTSWHFLLLQGATKRCRLYWLTNSLLVYEPKCGGTGGSCEASANEYSCAVCTVHGAQINFGDLTLYLTYGLKMVMAMAMAKSIFKFFLSYQWNYFNQMKLEMELAVLPISHYCTSPSLFS